MTRNNSNKVVEIPPNFLRVTCEKFRKVSNVILYVQNHYKNATSYQPRAVNPLENPGEVFGYLENSTNQFYLREDILNELDSGTWDSRAI